MAGGAKILPLHPKAVLLPFQARWLKDGAIIKLLEKSRQVGATWITALGAVETVAPMGARYDCWVSSRDELQAKLFIKDCQFWGKIVSMAKRGQEGRPVRDEQTASYAIRFANGRAIYSMSSNPDAQAGKRGTRILDEFALHPDPRRMWTIAQPGITWGGTMQIISTHRGSGSYFAELIREIKEKGNPKNISHHRVTLEDALNQGLLYKLQAALPDNHEVKGMDEAEYYDYVKRGCVDEEAFRQEYMCEPADDTTAFLDYQLITQCEIGQDWEIELHETAGRQLYAGLDIGRKYDLTVLWVLEVLGDVLMTRKVIALKNMPKADQERVIWPWMRAVRRTCVDYTGIGIGWGDDAQRNLGKSKVENVAFTGRVKEELAYPVRSLMEERRLRIPSDPAIRADLRQVSKEITAAGNVRFTAERSPDGHADRFWALALAIHAASIPSARIAYQSAGIRRVGHGAAMKNYLGAV